MTQQTLRRHDNERLPPSPQDLPPQAMEKLNRRGGLNDLNIVVRSQLEKSLEARARMFGALTFKAMGKQ